MLDELKSIKFNERKPRATFMEVSGYPHFENVTSNILSFFFTSDAEHGFEDLFFKSLVSLVAGNNIQLTQGVSAERECQTQKTNRLDIVLRNEAYIVGIENKIFSGIQNDLEDYKKTVDHLAKQENKVPLHIILSLKNESSVATSKGFVNITYHNLFESIKSNLGSYMQTADSTWLLFLKDFMNTINALQKAGGNMNKEFLTFIVKNQNTVEKLLVDCFSIKAEFTSQTKRLLGLVDLSKYEQDMKFITYCYNPRIDLFSSLVIDIKQGDQKILVVETYIEPTGWHVSIWNRYGKAEGKALLEKKLNSLNIKFHNYNFDKNPDRNYVVIEDFDFEVPFELLTESITRAMDIAKIVKI